VGDDGVVLGLPPTSYEHVAVSDTHGVNTPVMRADSIVRLGIDRSSHKQVAGHPGELAIGNLAIDPDGQQVEREPRRAMGKSTASIPELPWRRQAP
jgi:hypothetical protein